jgi:hypothetical protein
VAFTGPGAPGTFIVGVTGGIWLSPPPPPPQDVMRNPQHNMANRDGTFIDKYYLSGNDAAIGEQAVI